MTEVNDVGTSDVIFDLLSNQGPPAPVVANAIKFLQACIYKSVNTGQFLTSLVTTSIAKFILLMLDSLVFKSENKH